MLDITYASIHELHNAYRENKLTVTEVVLAHLERIAKIDSCEGGLKSVIEINPDALFIAKRLDREWRESKQMQPLFGIPVLLKDNIGTSDKMRTSAGSIALADHRANDTHFVRRLRDAGAVIIGKANMTEFANYMTRDGMPSGYSSRGGQTLCPYNREETPSGSSSGSAVAVAAGLSTISVGTETCGSIVAPAGQNGIVGIKPTLGLVTRTGVIPISGTFDTAGPMARNVTDAAILLGVMAWPDFFDKATLATMAFEWNVEEDEPTPPIPDYTKSLTGERLDGIRIGLNREKEFEKTPENDEAIAAFDKFCELLTEAGATLVDNIEMESRFDTLVTIMRYEFKACINDYLSNNITTGRGTKMRSLKDIIEYNQANAAIALKYGQSLLLEAENKASGNLTEPAYLEALIEREKAITEMDGLFTKHNLDVLLGDTFGYTAPFTGFPSMTIPIGQRQDNNIPLHAYWTARRLDEAKMITVAYIVEKLLGLSLRPNI